MARGTSLLDLIDQFKVEAKLALGANSGKDSIPAFKKLLSRVQQDLYDDYDWPFLRIWASKTISAGQRYYDVPAEMNLERIEEVRLKWNGTWDYAFDPGIDFEQYSVHDSELDERSDPPRRWDIRRTSDSAEQIEIWPVPATSGGKMSFQGLRKIPELVNDTDVCFLDGRLVALFAASEYLDSRNEGSGQRKLAQAQQLLSNLKGRAVATSPSRRVGTGSGRSPRDFRGIQIRAN